MKQRAECLLCGSIVALVCVVSTAAAQRKAPALSRAQVVRQRADWFYQQRAYPLDRIPPGAHRRALDQRGMMEVLQPSSGRRLLERLSGVGMGALAPASGASTSASPSLRLLTLSSTEWTPIGPQPTNNANEPFSPVSGRVTALAVDPADPDVAYLGGAEGGVWKTTDGGSTWAPLTDNQPSLAVGSIAIDPSNPQTIYVGTGEENFSADNYYGAGILKSIDGGSTWTQIPGPFASPFGSDRSQGGAYIGSIAVSQSNPQVILAAVNFSGGPSVYPPFSSGVYLSTDGGSSWSQVEYYTVATQVMFDPANGSTAYAAFYGAGVYISIDGGQTWNPDNGTSTSVLPSTNVGRIALAIDPQNTSTLYAGVGAASYAGSNSDSFIGLFKTVDGGAHWTQLPSSAFPDASGYCSTAGGNPQCNYDNVVAVDPASSAIFVGGSAEGLSPGTGVVWRSQDGGTSWSDIDPPPTSSGVQALHPDVHAIAFAHDGSRLYVGTDGGVWSSLNVTTSPVTWTNLNASLALTQFYPGMSIDPGNPYSSLGGTQDNGTQVYGGSASWEEAVRTPASPNLCGDGGWTAIGPPIYAACTWKQGVWTFDASTNSWGEVDSGIDTSETADFVPPLVMDPANPQTLYFGAHNLYQSTNGGTYWYPIVYYGATSSEYFTSAAVAPSDSETVYAVTNVGHVALTTSVSAGGWSDVTNGPLPKRWATMVAVDPNISTTAYVTYSGFSGFSDSAGHVFETTTGGSSWTDISGNLPNTPVNDIVVDPDTAGTLYVATDVGVFMTSDGGTTWTPINSGLPNVAVLSLKLNEGSRILRAGTHGRSAWDLFVPGNLPVANLSSAAVDFGNQPINTISAAQTVTLTNSGSSPMTITGVSLTGANAANFAETDDCPASLASGGTCTISVTFSPSAINSYSAILEVADNAPASPQQVSLSGSGINPTASVSPTSLAFGNQVLGVTSAHQTVTLGSTGQSPLVITSISVTGADATDFSESDDCTIGGSGLANGSSCTINVTFTPAAGGSRTGTLAIADDAADSPQTVALSGTGITDFSIAPASGSTTSATVTAGGTATYSLTIAPSGLSGNVSFTCAVAPAGPTCSVSPASVTLNGTDPANVTVNVATTAPSLAPPVSSWPRWPALPITWPAAMWLAIAGLLLAVAVRQLTDARRRPASPSCVRVDSARRYRLAWRLAPLGVLLMFVALAASCGGGGGTSTSSTTHTPTGGTPAGTYNITVTGTSGSLSHSTTLTLTVN